MIEFIVIILTNIYELFIYFIKNFTIIIINYIVNFIIIFYYINIHVYIYIGNFLSLLIKEIKFYENLHFSLQMLDIDLISSFFLINFYMLFYLFGIIIYYTFSDKQKKL